MLSETLRRARTFLASARNADASWPYVPGKPSGVEPTCYAAMALQQPLTKAPGSHLQWEHALTLLTLQRLNGSPQVCGSLTQTLLNTEVQHAAPNNAISELDSN